MEKKEHDLMMDMLANQEMSIDDLIGVGLTSDNTSLQDKETYKNNDWVRDHFKDNYGQFDEVRFNTFYNNAKTCYNYLTYTNYDQSLENQVTYHRDNIFAPVEQRQQGPYFVQFITPNPYQITSSIHELGKTGERTKSIEELAQTNKVLLNPTTAGDNLENAQWGDTPNDNFWGYFLDTLVLAQYDSDGTHVDPITGEAVNHSAGDLKLDDTGNFYYEKLDGRDIYGKRVLNKSNVLTVDGSAINQYDFFDTDDLNQKSIGGSLLRNLSLVGTMFIPYVGPWVAGLSVATQSAGMLGTLGKMLVGSESPTFSALEGWSKSMSRSGSVTEYAAENPWCWENMINLIGDVAGQLKEQRFIFEKIPYVFKGVNVFSKEGKAAKLAELTKKQQKLAASPIQKLNGQNANDILKAEVERKAVATLNAEAELDSFIKGYYKIGEVLSKGYMTALTVGDTYGEAKAAGASDIDATLLTLGYAAGEYALLSTGLGEWILPELRQNGFKYKAIAKALTSLDKETESLYKKFGRTLANFPKEGKKEYTKKLFNIGKNIARAEYSVGQSLAKSSLAAGLGEGLEEVSEEFLADFSKGCYDVVKWLQGDSTRLNAFGYNFEKKEFDFSEVRDRYAMSLVGGFIGGGITNAGTSYSTLNDYKGMNFRSAVEQLVYMGRNQELPKFIQAVKKMTLANPNLSATEFEVDNDQIIFAPGTKQDNQDLYAKQAVINQANMIQEILQANGAVSDSRVLNAQTLNDLRFNALHNSTTAGNYLQEYNSLATNLVGLVKTINEKFAAVQDTNQDGTVSDKEFRRSRDREAIKQKMSPEEQKTIDDLEKELKDTRQAMNDLVSGKRAYEFIADSLFEMTTAISGYFVTPTYPLFAENYYSKKFSELTDTEKSDSLEKYKKWKETEGKDTLKIMSRIYRKIAEESSKVIKQHEQQYLETPQDLLQANDAISKLFTVIYNNTGAYNLEYLDDSEKFLELAQEASNDNFTNLAQILVKNFGTQEDIDAIKAILNQSKNLSPQLTVEEKKKELSKIEQQVTEELQNIIFDNIVPYTNKFIDRGFINQETKQQLLNMLTTIRDSVLRRSQRFEAEDLFGTGINPYTSLILQIGQAINKIKQLENTPIEQNLNEFAISIGEDPVNFTELIQKINNSFNDTSKDVANFTLSETLYNELNNAIYLLELYQAAIRGARTDNAGLNNLFGYNATLNEVSTKLGNESKLAEITKEVADIFDNDIQNNLRKLKFLKNLYNVNQGNKLNKQDRVSVKKDLLIYKRLKYIVQVGDQDDPLKDWEGFADLKTVIDSATKHEKYLTENTITLNQQEREEFEAETIAIENAIYDFFQIESNKQKLQDPKKLAEFINPKKLNLYTEAKELLNEGLDNLDDNSIVWWIATRAALRSQDFYFQYKQIIDPTEKDPIAPIPTQELAVYNNYASIINGEVLSNFYKAYRYAIVNDWKTLSLDRKQEILRETGISERFADNSFNSICLNFLQVPKYQNIVLTEGIPGSGKSTGVFKSTLKMLKSFHLELLKNVAVVHGANSKSATVLRDSVGLTNDNSKSFGREDFMKEINSTWKEYNKDESTGVYEIGKDQFILTNEKELRSSQSVNETQNPFSLIIIDEISKFTTYDLDQIDKYAQKYGITVLVAGDFDQSGIEGKHSVASIKEFQNIESYTVNLERTNFIRSPKLGVSMRTDNMIKSNNLHYLQTYLQDPTGKVELNYYEDETGLYGDKVITYSAADNETKNTILEQVKQEVEKLRATLKNGEKIGYIYDDKNSPIYEALKDKDYIDLKYKGAAQGLEGRYYLIELSEGKEKASYLKDIYTGISRAEQGSILVTPYKKFNTEFKSNAVSEKVEENYERAIPIYSKKRKDLLDKLITSGNVSQIIPRKVQKTTPPPPSNGGLSGGIPGGSSSGNGSTGSSSGNGSTGGTTVDQYRANLLENITNATTANEVMQLLDQAYTDFPKLKDDNDLRIYATNKSRFLEYPSMPTVPFNNIRGQYGDHLNTTQLDVSVDGSTIPIGIALTPFESTALTFDGTVVNGESTIVNLNGDTSLLYVTIDNYKIPFYNKGNGWYPVFGIGEDGTLLVPEGQETNYDDNILEAISEQLYNAFGNTPASPEINIEPFPKYTNSYVKELIKEGYNQDTPKEKIQDIVNNSISEIHEVVDRLKTDTGDDKTTMISLSPKEVQERYGTEATINNVNSTITDLRTNFDNDSYKLTFDVISRGFLEKEGNKYTVAHGTASRIITPNRDYTIVQVKIGNITIPFVRNNNYQTDVYRPTAGFCVAGSDVIPIYFNTNRTNFPQEFSKHPDYLFKISEAVTNTFNNTLGINQTIFHIDKIVEPYNNQLNPPTADDLSFSNIKDDYVDDLEDKIIREINSIINNQRSKNKKPEVLIYEDDINSITNTDVINEKDYKGQLDQISEDSSGRPSSKISVDQGLYKLYMLLHSFNTYETGLQTDADGNLINQSQDWADARIDSINGLLKIDKALNQVHTIDQYKEIIGNLRSVIFNTQDKSQLQKRIESILGLPEIYCTFALKSSPYINRNNPPNLKGGYLGRPSPFGKSINEHTEYNGSNDTRSSEWHSKSIVLIIGTESTGNILELPLLALSSPFTLVQTVENNLPVFPDMKAEYDKLRNQGVSAPDISAAMIKKFSNNPKYQALVDLFELFNFTVAGISYIKDPQWTIAGNLQALGSHFVTDAGYHMGADGFKYNDKTNPESEWTTIQEFSMNPNVNITSKVMTSLYGTVEEIEGRTIVNPGHPFILVSYNKEIEGDDAIIKQYIKQQQDPTLKKDVVLVYVLPPKVPVRKYFENVRNIIGKGDNIEYIGNLFTSYNLLKVLIQNDQFKNALDNNFRKGVAQKVQDIIDELNSMFNPEDTYGSRLKQKDKLYSEYDWSDLGLGTHKLAGLLDAVLDKVAYNHNTITGDIIITKNEDNIALMEQILANNGIDSVYYKVRVTKDSISNNYFTIPDQGDNYTINGLPFKIHGKVDSPTFQGDMHWLIKQFLDNIRVDNNRMYTTDSVTYSVWNKDRQIALPGNSKISTPRKKGQSKDRIIKGTINKIKTALGIDVSSYFENTTTQEAQKNIVQLINNDNNQTIAFTLMDFLYVSDRIPEIEGPVQLYDSDGNPITDIYKVYDNNGKYYFTIETTYKGNPARMDCVFDKSTKILKMDTPASAVVTETNPLVTEENFQQYITTGRSLLKSSTDMYLQRIFQVNTYEEFMEYLDSWIYLGDYRINELNELLKNSQLSQEEQEIIKNLIEFEKSHDFEAINEEDTDEENKVLCSGIINVKFF